jgi:hypothetical protein
MTLGPERKKKKLTAKTKITARPIRGALLNRFGAGWMG